jgi:hypothetical protein
MTNLITTCSTVNINFNRYSGSEELLAANQCLPEQNLSDGEPDCLSEPPVDFDPEQEARYHAWQESLSYLIEEAAP